MTSSQTECINSSIWLTFTPPQIRSPDKNILENITRVLLNNSCRPFSKELSMKPLPSLTTPLSYLIRSEGSLVTSRPSPLAQRSNLLPKSKIGTFFFWQMTVWRNRYYRSTLGRSGKQQKKQDRTSPPLHRLAQGRKDRCSSSIFVPLVQDSDVQVSQMCSLKGFPATSSSAAQNSIATVGIILGREGRWARRRRVVVLPTVMSPTTRTDDDSFCTFYNVLHGKYIYSNNNLSMLFQLLALTALLLPCLGDPCQTHIAELTALAILNKPKFLQEVHGYVLYSGKMIEDLGLPNSCTKQQKYSYFTGSAKATNEEVEYRAYLGICFSNKCTAEDIDRNSEFIVSTVLNITNATDASMIFRQPSLEIESTAGEFLFVGLFALLILASLKEAVFNFFKSCKKEAHKEEDELIDQYAVQFGEDYDPTLLIIQESESTFKKICLKSKLHEYFTAEQSSKILSFSALRILAVPLALYGYLFYLCNLGSYNYASFNEQIYTQRYAKIALTAYYIPDILFFMSGFLLTKKALEMIDVQPRGNKVLVKLVLKKLTRLVPLYWAFIVIYWQISPALHSGPIWFEYLDEASTCNSAWWRVLLFMDNWFQSGCYDFAWYIPAEIQLTLLTSLLLWVYLKHHKVGFILIILLTITSWILTLVLSAPFPSSLESTLHSDSITYFKSTLSHMPYYLIGVLNGYLTANQKLKETLHKFTGNKCFRMAGITVGMFLIVLIVVRPAVWEGELGFELGLAKSGMFLGVYLLMFWTMFGGQVVKTVIHRIAILSKGALLMGGLVVGSYFWGLLSFPYLDNYFLLDVTIANCFIAFPFGALVIALLWPRPRKEQQILL